MPCQSQAPSASTAPEFFIYFAQKMDVDCTPSSASVEIAPGIDGASVSLLFRALDASGFPDNSVPALGFGTVMVPSAGTADVDWARALVHKEVAGVAASRSVYGIEGQLVGIGASLTTGYEPAGSLTPTVWGGPAPAGTSPVIAHTLTPATADPSLRVLQQVLDYSGTLPAGMDSTYEVVQRFRVPQQGNVQWVELVLSDLMLPGADLSVSIYPAAGGAPPLTVPPGAATASIPAPPGGLGFSSSYIFAAAPAFAAPYALVAGTDYFLHVRTTNTWDLATDLTNTLAEDLYHRPRSNSATWAVESGLDLTFRLIGTSGAATGVTSGSSAPGRLSLAVGPNPGRHSVTLAWAGGQGRAQVGIFDLAGRRLRVEPDAGAAASGSWTWDGTEAGGRAVPPGVYMARFESSHGELRVARIVLTR